MRNSSFAGVRLASFLALGIAFGSGILMALAAAPTGLWPLAWVALVPLWSLIFQPGLPLKRSVMLLALAWGIGYHGLALSWITGLHPLTWLGVPWLGSIAIALFCWVFITLWGTALVVIWAAVLVRLSGKGARNWLAGWQRVLVGTALWCVLEQLWSLTPLYWTSLSFTQSPGNLAILHLGQLSGPMVVTTAIVAVNGLLAEAWLKRQTEAASKTAMVPQIAVALLLLIGLHGVGFWLYSRPLADLPDSVLKVGIVQGNIPTRIKLSFEGIRRADTSYARGYRILAEQGVDAVLTSEGALPFQWNAANQQGSEFYQTVLQEQVVAWLGTFTAQNGHITQNLLTLAGDGSIYSHYDKVKLVPLGEYIPFQEILGGIVGRLSPIEATMVPGSTNQQFETPFGRAIASICYESAFPDLFRKQAAKGGQFILTASNLDPYSEMLMAQHQAQDVMRSIETDRWAIRATNTGYSGILDPHGRIRWRSQPKSFDIHAATIYRRQTKTLYVRWGDWLTPLLGMGASVVLLIFLK